MKLDYFDGFRFDANYVNPLFKSGIYATCGNKIQVNLCSVYIATQESVQATSNSIEFIFMDLV